MRDPIKLAYDFMGCLPALTEGRKRMGEKNAPERIWACMDGPMVGLFVSGGNTADWPEYVRADIADRLAEADADAVRIVACWNAMTGIEDPAAFMDEVREVLDVLEDYFDNRADADQAPGDTPTPNEEMRHQVTIRALLAKMEGK